jgi:hypothetical protein
LPCGNKHRLLNSAQPATQANRAIKLSRQRSNVQNCAC